MEENPKYFNLADNVIIKEAAIRWVKQLDECLYVCSRSDGCGMNYYGGALKVCKKTDKQNYDILNNYLERNTVKEK